MEKGGRGEGIKIGTGAVGAATLANAAGASTGVWISPPDEGAKRTIYQAMGPVLGMWKGKGKGSPQGGVRQCEAQDAAEMRVQRVASTVL